MLVLTKQARAAGWPLRVLDALVLALAGVYLVMTGSAITTFYLPWPQWTEQALLIALAAAAAIRLPLAARRMPTALLSLPMAGVFALVYRESGFVFLLYLAALTVGFAGMDHRKPLGLYLSTAGVLLLATVLAALSGAIDNLVFIKAGYLRSAWGVAYPTDFASWVFFALLILWVRLERLPDLSGAARGLAAAGIAWYIARSSTCLLCGLLMAAAAVYCAFERWMVRKRGRLSWMRRGVSGLLVAAMPLFAVATMALVAAYHRDMNFAVRANRLLSDHLKYAADALYRYGVKPFGTPFEQVGAGFSTYSINNYNFVDSSYPLILVRYGWVLALALGLSWTWTVIRAVRSGDRRLALAMALIAFHAISEHHFIEAGYNLLLVMPFCAYGPPEEGAACRGRALLPGALTLVICAGAAALLPRSLSWLRTMFALRELTGGGANGWPALALCLFGIGLAALALWAIHGILDALLERRRVGWIRGLALAVCALALAGGLALGQRWIGKGLERNRALIDADRPALEAVLAGAEGPVYSDVLPEVYRREFGGLSDSLLSGEDLARRTGVTVLTDASEEHYPFMQSGCLYAQISDAHALYTSDAAAAHALEAAGYRTTAYYSNVKYEDLAQASAMNGLPYSEEEGLQLEGPTRSLVFGAPVSLYGGRYTAAFRLRTMEAFVEEDYVLCTLRVSAFWGEDILAQREVRISQFDETGSLTVEIPFTANSSRGVEFLVFMQTDARLCVEEIAYRRTPANDVHAFYDSHRRKVREEYYTLDGAQDLVGGGWFACEYEYDYEGNVSLVRYYDRDGQPAITYDGYSQVGRKYDIRRRIIREDYFDGEGAPVAVANGYAATEYAYDGDGNPVEQRFLDAEGRLCFCAKGYALLRRQYDARGNVVREAWFGVEGEPVSVDGCAALEREYDESDNATLIRYLDGEDRPVETAAGYAAVRREYDLNHHPVREAYLDAAGEPVTLEAGYAILERAYDDAGNVTVERYLDRDGLPVTLAEGYAEVRREYDGKHQAILEAYFDGEGNSTLCASGYASTRRRYDDAGDCVQRWFYGVDGSPACTGSGYAQLTRTFNARHQVLTESYYDADGQPMALSSGQHMLEYEYDEAGRVGALRYYGTDLAPVDLSYGFAEVRRSYDGQGRLIREEYYDAQGSPTERREGWFAVETDYDANGGVAQVRYYSMDGTLLKTE